MELCAIVPVWRFLLYPNWDQAYEQSCLERRSCKHCFLDHSAAKCHVGFSSSSFNFLVSLQFAEISTVRRTGIIVQCFIKLYILRTRMVVYSEKPSQLITAKWKRIIARPHRHSVAFFFLAGSVVRARQIHSADRVDQSMFEHKNDHSKPWARIVPSFCHSLLPSFTCRTSRSSHIPCRHLELEKAGTTRRPLKPKPWNCPHWLRNETRSGNRWNLSLSSNNRFVS